MQVIRNVQGSDGLQSCHRHGRRIMNIVDASIDGAKYVQTAH